MGFNILIQLFNLIAFIFLLLSYWQKDINKILFMQLIALVFYILHYSFLGATAALFVVSIELIRDFIYYKTDWDRYIFFALLPIYSIILVFAYNGFFSVLPTLASIIDGYGLAIRKDTALISGIISYTIWIIYDYSCGSYMGMICSLLMVISNSLSLLGQRKKL